MSAITGCIVARSNSVLFAPFNPTTLRAYSMMASCIPGRCRGRGCRSRGHIGWPESSLDAAIAEPARHQDRIHRLKADGPERSMSCDSK